MLFEQARSVFVYDHRSRWLIFDLKRRGSLAGYAIISAVDGRGGGGGYSGL